MLTETGIVTAVKQHENKYGVVVNKEWYGGFGQCPVQKGDKVKIDYKLNGKYKNIRSIEKTENVEIKSDRVEENISQRSDPVVDDIHLQVCLKAAAQILTGTKTSATEVAKYTKELLKELWG